MVNVLVKFYENIYFSRPNSFADFFNAFPTILLGYQVSSLIFFDHKILGYSKPCNKEGSFLRQNVLKSFQMIRAFQNTHHGKTQVEFQMKL